MFTQPNMQTNLDENKYVWADCDAVAIENGRVKLPALRMCIVFSLRHDQMADWWANGTKDAAEIAVVRDLKQA